MAKRPVDKGGRAEEAIRYAFLQRGYFVARGLPYRYGGLDITDVDLLLYGLTGAGREMINVDVKNKRTPQAMERTFWAMGIRAALRCDRCIVATSETNPAVLEFGRRFGVSVLDGRYLQANMSELPVDRIAEEDLIDLLWVEDAAEFSGTLKDRYLAAKSRLLLLRTFDASNAFLRDVGDCLADLLAYPSCRDAVRRVLYAISAFLCVSLDSQWARTDFSDNARRVEEIDLGLRYGSAGRQRIDDFISTLKQCRSDDPAVERVIQNIERQIEDDVRELRTDMIAEFVGKTAADLFPLARDFDAAAFAAKAPDVAGLNTRAKSLVFMLADYFSLDRVKIGKC